MDPAKGPSSIRLAAESQDLAPRRFAVSRCPPGVAPAGRRDRRAHEGLARAILHLSPVGRTPAIGVLVSRPARAPRWSHATGGAGRVAQPVAVGPEVCSVNTLSWPGRGLPQGRQLHPLQLQRGLLPVTLRARKPLAVRHRGPPGNGAWGYIVATHDKDAGRYPDQTRGGDLIGREPYHPDSYRTLDMASGLRCQSEISSHLGRSRSTAC